MLFCSVCGKPTGFGLAGLYLLLELRMGVELGLKLELVLGLALWLFSCTHAVREHSWLWNMHRHNVRLQKLTVTSQGPNCIRV